MLQNIKSFVTPNSDQKPMSANSKPVDLTRLELSQPQKRETENKRLSSALSRINSILSPN